MKTFAIKQPPPPTRLHEKTLRASKSPKQKRLKNRKIPFDNETILDVLLDAAGKNNIDVDKTGSGATAYVSGIDGIYERDYGAMSGWICKLNGTGIAKSAGAITVKAGDQIEWTYKEN